MKKCFFLVITFCAVAFFGVIINGISFDNAWGIMVFGSMGSMLMHKMES